MRATMLLVVLDSIRILCRSRAHPGAVSLQQAPSRSERTLCTPPPCLSSLSCYSQLSTGHQAHPKFFLASGTCKPCLALHSPLPTPNPPGKVPHIFEVPVSGIVPSSPTRDPSQQPPRAESRGLVFHWRFCPQGLTQGGLWEAGFGGLLRGRLCRDGLSVAKSCPPGHAI